MFFEEIGLLTVESSEVEEATEVNEAAEISKAWKITTEVFKVIQVLEFNDLRTNITLFWCFGRHIFDRIMKTFSTFSVRGFWSQSLLLFLKLIDETQMNTQMFSFWPKNMFWWPSRSSKYVKSGRKTLYFTLSIIAKLSCGMNILWTP